MDKTDKPTDEQRALELILDLDERATDGRQIYVSPATEIILAHDRETAARTLERAAKHICGYTTHASRSDDGEGGQMEGYVSVSVLRRIAAAAREGREDV